MISRKLFDYIWTMCGGLRTVCTRKHVAFEHHISMACTKVLKSVLNSTHVGGIEGERER